jgi:hypothetical protein
MPTDRRRRGEAEVTPLNDPAFRRHSVHFDNLEFQRRFEQNLIRYGLVTAEQVTKEINNTVVVGGGGGGGGGGTGCYWVKEGSNLVYYDGNVGVGVHPHSNDFEVRGNVLVEAKAEAPYVEIRNWSDTAYDPMLRWALGATPETMFGMGVDDSDSNKWKIANGATLGAVPGWTFGTTIIFGNSYSTATNQILAVSTSDLGTLTDYSLAPPYVSGGIFNCIYVHTDGTIYVCDNDKGVAHFDANLNLIQLHTNSWFTATSSVYGICYWDGYFYVATSGIGTAYDGVFQFDSTFSVATRYLGSADSGDPDYIVAPKGVATDGTLFYVCNGTTGLMVFTMAGVYVETITTANSIAFGSLWGVQADGTYIYVTDRSATSAHRIVVLNAADRSWVADLDCSGANYTPWDVTVDDDYVYACILESVVDFIRVIKFDKATWALVSDTQVKRPGGLNSGSRGIGILREWGAGEDLLVLHQDGSYFEVYPVTRFMDDIRLHETSLTTSDYVGLAAPAAVTASYTLALPVAAAGATKHLYSDSANQLAWGQDVTPTGSPSFVRITLTQAAGTAPMTVTSTTVVTNLNSDLWDGYHAFQGDTLEPNGFEDRADSAITWDDGTRTLTITGTNFVVWYKGVRYLLSTDTSQIADTTGLYWFYYEISGATLNLTNSTVFPGFDAPLVASVYWNTVAGMDKGLVADERHGIVMDAATHEWAHETIGVRYESGLAGTFTDTTFSIALGELHDEDLDFSITPAKTTCDVLYLDGSANWKWLANQTLYYYTSGGNLYWNNGTTLTAAGANKYVAVWIFATTSPVRPIISIIGQVVSDTITDARNNNTYQGLSLGTLPFKEMKLLYRVILRNDVTPYEEVQDLRAVSNISSGTYVATVHSALTGLTTGDDHTQYAYCKIHATDAPTVNDDITTYREGTIWIEQDANRIWLCADNADGAAVWHGLDQDLLVTSSPTFDAPTVTGLIVNGLASMNALIEGDEFGVFYITTNNGIRIYPGGLAKPTVYFNKETSLGIGIETFGTSATKTLAIGTGTAPSDSPADSVQFYSADFAAGNACPYFRTENGTVIGLNQSLLTTDGPTFDHAHLTSAAYIGNIDIVNNNIRMNTVDGSDNGYIYLCGGGTANTISGGYIAVAGNEFSVNAAKGAVYLFAGQGDGGANKGNIYMQAADDALSSINTVWLNSSGYFGINVGSYSPEARFQVGKKLNLLEVIGNTTVCRFLGGTQSQVSETILRLVRPISSGVYYGASVDFNVYAYDAGGGGTGYNPATQLDIKLKNAQSYTETADILVMALTAQKNVGFGTSVFGTSAANVLAIASGTAPSTSPADCFQMYSADLFALAGAAHPHFRTEDGKIRTLGTADVVVPAAGTPKTITAADCAGSIITNASAAGDVEYDLPAAQVGMVITFFVVTANKMKIDPNGTDQIMVLTNAAGDFLESDAVIGSYITLKCLVANKWYKTDYAGTWTEE